MYKFLTWQTHIVAGLTGSGKLNEELHEGVGADQPVQKGSGQRVLDGVGHASQRPDLLEEDGGGGRLRGEEERLERGEDGGELLQRHYQQLGRVGDVLGEGGEGGEGGDNDIKTAKH